MSDDLVKRLRELYDDSFVETIHGPAADRIEELEAKLLSATMDGYDMAKHEYRDRIEELEANINIKADFIDATINQLAASDQRIEELEAKLARAVPLAEVARLAGKLGRAVEGLHDIAKEFDGPRSGLTDFGEREHYKWMACKLRDKASAVLAELKGQNDE